MKKRIISLALVALMLLSMVPAALAAKAVSVSEAAMTLAALDIMVGDQSGNLNLGAAVTRAEFIKIATAASVYKDNVGAEASVAPYPDVPRSHWAAGYIQAGVSAGLINGYLDGTFRPNNTITLAEGVTIGLRLLGYTDSDFTGAYPSGQMNLYRSMDLDTGVSASDNSTPLTRQDCLFLAYNLLTATNKQGLVHITTLGYSLTPAGEIDLVSLVNRAMEGPVIAEGSWRSQIPFDVNGASVTRNGLASTVSAIQSGDVVYYSKSMRSLWVYRNHVTGTYQQAMPNTANPTTIVVAGNSYSFETSAAAFDASDLGAFAPGDAVTVYLGRSNTVAAVRAPGEGGGLLYGVAAQVFTGTYYNAQNQVYTAPTVALVATDGNTYTYTYDKNMTIKTGDLLSVNITANGATVSRVGAKKLSGTVNSAATGLGSYTFASQVEILDTYRDSNVTKIFVGRLAGVRIKEDMVRFYATNGAGEITHLILNDVTGDMNQYGVVSECTTVSVNMVVQSHYTYDIAGTSGYFGSQNTNYGEIRGPFALVMNGGAIEKPRGLTSRPLTGIDGLVGNNSGDSFRLADNYLVYIQDGSKYSLTTWNQVAGGNYTFTAWYDAIETDGGLVRVVIAKVK